MTLQTIPRANDWPGLARYLTGAPALANHGSLIATTQYDCIVICAPFNMTLSHIWANVNTASGSPSVDARIETVGTDGLPTGTLWAANTNVVTGVLAVGGNLMALTASATILRGQFFAVKLAWAAGTIGFRAITNINGLNSLPYYVLNNTGTPVKSRLDACAMALGSSATDWYNIPGLWPVLSVSASAFNNTSAAHRGLRFKVAHQTRCIGFRDWNSTSIGDFSIGILDDLLNEVDSSITAFDGDKSSGLTNGSGFFYFDSPAALSAGVQYRAMKRPDSATNITLEVFTLPSADFRSAMPGGTDCHEYTFVTGTDDITLTAVVPLIDLLFDQYDDGAGSGAVIPRIIG